MRPTSDVHTYLRLVQLLRPYVWPRGVVALVCMLLFSGVEASIPFAIKFGADRVFGADLTPDARGAGLGLLVVGVLVLTTLRGLLDYSAAYLSGWIGMRVVTDLRHRVSGHLQKLDLAYFQAHRAGQLTARVTADCVLVRAAVTDAVQSLFKDTTTLIMLLGAAIYLDWRLTLLAFVALPAVAAPLRLLSRRVRRVSRERQKAVGGMNARLHENVQGARVVKVFGAEGHETEQLRAHAEKIFRANMRVTRVRAFPITDLLAGIGIAGVLWVGGGSVVAGTRSIGTFSAFLASIVLLYEPFKKLVRTNYAIQQGLASADRVFSVLDTRPAIDDRADAAVLPPVREGLEFDHVHFEYEAGRPVLQDVSFRVRAGSVVALVGESGGGKSTIADLVPRLYDVTAGRIAIDGHDVRDVTLASLRAQIAVVTQFTFLFNDTIRNNIAYGDRSRSLGEIVAAAQAANAHDFIEALPAGYDTHIGDLGVRLSGGQRQRIAIARALLRDAPILVLDEATSALDTESEQLVQEALDRLMAQRTTLVVAHRLSTIRHADEILVVRGGRIVERGRHDELMARRGDYHRLSEGQLATTLDRGALGSPPAG